MNKLFISWTTSVFEKHQGRDLSKVNSENTSVFFALFTEITPFTKQCLEEEKKN